MTKTKEKPVKATKTAWPTASEMKEFAKRFTQEEWNQLIKSKEFVNMVGDDIKHARILAEKLLKK